ncbi:MAG: carboxypeptidase-like regulatory domain-containing protein [Candidatus Kapaibacterium sp.]
MVNRFSLLALLLAVLSLSCGTPTAPQAQGNISGRVYLQPRAGQIDQAKHDITVALTGNQTYTTTSVDSGAFVLSNVNQGIYSITYSKAGYISRSMDNIQFVGNGTLKLSTVYLNQADTIIDPPDPKNVDRRVFGYVRLYDENGDSLSDHSGVSVTINGTSLTATSEKSGIFYFEKYPKGDFELTVSKAGFSNLRVPKVSFPDSNSLQGKKQLSFYLYSTIGLTKPANLSAQIDSALYNFDYNFSKEKDVHHSFVIETAQDGTRDTLIYIFPHGRILPAGYGKQVAVYTVIGDTPDISIDNYSGKDSYGKDDYAGRHEQPLSNPERVLNSSSAGRVYLSTDFTRWHIERAGKEVYIKTYVKWKIPSVGVIHSFVDLYTERLLTTGFVSSNVVKITLPSKYTAQ